MEMILAEPTGFEPATSTVTVWRSNQLSYGSRILKKMSRGKTKEPGDSTSFLPC